MSEIEKDVENTNIDWEEVILKLQSFTRYLVNGKGWFRGKNTKTFLKGKEIDDYVFGAIFGAIEYYLFNPDKYNKSRGTFINYLKYNLICSMVINDLVSAENRTSKDVFAFANQDEQENEDSRSYLDSIMPHVEAYFDQEIDYNWIMDSIEAEVVGDEIAEEIFLGHCCYDMKRREIIEESKITEGEYNNGVRRLNTILKNTAIKFELNK